MEAVRVRKDEWKRCLAICVSGAAVALGALETGCHTDVEPVAGPAEATLPDIPGGTLVTLQPLACGNAFDAGPSDGVFDTFVQPLSDGSRIVSATGFAEYRVLCEFDLSGLPANAVARAAIVSAPAAVFEGPRVMELHGNEGDGTVGLAEFSVNHALVRVNIGQDRALVLNEDGLLIGLEPPVLETIEFDLTPVIQAAAAGSLVGPGRRVSLGFREIRPEGAPNYTVMRIGEPTLSLIYTIQETPPSATAPAGVIIGSVFRDIGVNLRISDAALGTVISGARGLSSAIVHVAGGAYITSGGSSAILPRGLVGALIRQSRSCLRNPQTLYHVRQGATGGDGSAGRPFGRVQDALAAGTASGACTLRVEIKSGVYSENTVLRIDRPTMLLGEWEHTNHPTLSRAGVSNLGGHALELRNLRLSEPGGYGVRQTGGTLSVSDLDISHTTAVGTIQRIFVGGGAGGRPGGYVREIRAITDPTDGTAIYLDGGITAELTRVNVFSSAGQGLIAAGPDTDVRARDLEVSSSEMNEKARENVCDLQANHLGQGAVQAHDQATLVVRGFRILNNTYVGILLSRNANGVFNGVPDVSGATHACNASYSSRVAGTRAIDCRLPGGFNVHVMAESSLLMTDFLNTSSDLAGFQIDGDSDVPEVDLRNGLIEYHPTGVAISAPRYSLPRLEAHNMCYLNNLSNLNTDIAPIPWHGSPL